MKKVLTLGLIVGISIILFSCAKDGEQGPAGPAGADGNANVKTEMITVYGYEWEYEYPLYGVEKNSSLLTQEIVENGSVHVYMNVGEDMWLALPYLEFGYAYTVNSVLLYTGGDPTTSDMIYKLVAIEGNLVSKSSDVDFQNYDEVKSHFNLD